VAHPGSADSANPGPLNWIVTRPAAQAAGWVHALQALGQAAHALPLIDILPLLDPAPVRQAWAGLTACSLVVFVSGNAAEHFFALRPADCDWPAQTLAGSTGPGTSAALLAAGRLAGLQPAAIVDPGPEAPVYDSEALWAVLQSRDWQGRVVLVVRGEEGRDWLADTLRAAGAQVRFVAAYRRAPPVSGPASQALLARALAEPQRHVWLFSSSEAVGHLRALDPQADWSRSSAIASHPRIGQAAQQLGFGRVGLAPPRPADAVACAAQWASLPAGAPLVPQARRGSAPIQSTPQ
jgi:uroporphyrinogen-III synthase